MRYAMLLLAVVITGCGGAGRDESRDTNPSEELDNYVETPSSDKGDEPRSASGFEIAQSQAAFGADLYSGLKNREGNLFFSPFSIASVLTMTAAGARGETAEQMTSALHLPREMRNAHESFGGVFDELNSSKGIELSLANAVWAQSGLRIENEFKGIVERNYRAGLKSADYRAAPEPARNAINSWVEEQTRERIRDLIPQDAVTSDTRLVLANAIYFKGNWARQFKSSATEPAAFKLIGGGEAQVPFMYQKQRFAYKSEEAVQVLELPYEGGKFSMIIVLPNDIDGIKSIEKTLTAEKAEAFTDGLREIEIEVYLPKFTMTSEFSLADVLTSMGMPLAFSDAADFSGITDEEPLKISGVFHKAFVEVNEEGTEAAAATGAVVSVTSAMPRRFEFRADHPFLFFIRERESGLILFMGRVMDPR